MVKCPTLPSPLHPAPANRPDVWRYPKDIKDRTRVDILLDWHHGNTRQGAAGLFFETVFMFV
jgi:hypothetical protein